jgi:hypothetical protein
MVVLGQPKTSAEYIQATSRVGRDPGRPGLVVTLLNVHKPRDRSHYERFGTFHASFYRSVEATSVTPFSPRALDRALVGALVALCRQGDPVMTPARGAEEIVARRAALDAFAERFAARAGDHDAQKDPAEAKKLHDHVLQTCRSLLDDWLKIAGEMQSKNTKLQYQLWETTGPQRLLYDFLDPDLADLPPVRRRFRANRSMRDVEASVELFGDQRVAFVTSANFTEAAQRRNIEVGVLTRYRPMVERIRAYFMGLTESGQLTAVKLR